MMKKITLLFATLLSMAGAMKAETLTANFNSGLPEGWSLVGDLTNDDTRARSGKGIWTYSKSTTDNYVVTSVVEGDFEFYARAYNKNYASTVVVYEYTSSGFGSQLYTTGSMYSSSTPSWSKHSFSISKATQLAIVLNYAAIDDVTYTPGSIADGPDLAVKDNGTTVTSPYSYDFGLVTAGGATKEFSLSNPGTEGLGISVSETGNFGATLSETTIPAGGEVTLTVTMPEETGSSTVTITPDATSGIDPFVINVSGTIRDANKVFIDFADGEMPEGWTSVKIGDYSSGWAISEGFAYHSSSASSYYIAALTSPLLTFAEGEKLYFDVSRYGTSTWSTAMVKVQTSANGTDWTDIYTTPDNELVYDEWKTQGATMPAGNYYIRFYGGYAKLTNIYGGEISSAPILRVTPAEDFVAGKVTESVSKTYTVSNDGKGSLTVNIASSSADFTVAPTTLEDIAAGASADFTVTFNFTEGNYGEKTADITITPTYDETAAVTFTASAIVRDPNVWEEGFEDGTLPMGWVANNWTIGTFSSYENTTPMALAPSAANTTGTLITPCLSAKAGDVLTWDAYLNWNDEAMVVEYSADGQATWTEIYNYKAEDDGISTRYSHKAMSFTAPADGNYYLRFTSTYQNGVDNFYGFRLNLPDHILAITASNIPSSSASYMTMKEGISFNASVTLAESRGVSEEVTTKFYMGNEVIGIATETVEANGSKVVTIVCTPTQPATEGVEMHIEVEYAGGTLSTEPVTRYVNAAVKLELDETIDTEIVAGTYDIVTVKRTFNSGWNTIILPFAVSDLSIFGTDVKAFEFTGMNGEALTFTTVSSLNPAQPYIIYTETPGNEVIVATNVTISSVYIGAENIQTTRDYITFQGTYAPIAAPGMEDMYGVTTSGRIQKGSDKASIKGFRAYFVISEGINVKTITIDGEDATGIMTIDNGQQTTDRVIHNVAGQRINKVQKGINIVNGRKVLY